MDRDELIAKLKSEAATLGHDPAIFDNLPRRDVKAERLRHEGAAALAAEYEARVTLASDPLRAAAARDRFRPGPNATLADVADAQRRQAAQADSEWREHFRAVMATHGIDATTLPSWNGSRGSDASFNAMVAQRTRIEGEAERFEEGVTQTIRELANSGPRRPLVGEEFGSPPRRPAA